MNNKKNIPKVIIHSTEYNFDVHLCFPIENLLFLLKDKKKGNVCQIFIIITGG